MKQTDAVAGLIAALTNVPCTYEQAAQASGMSERAIAGWIKSFRDARLVRIAEWRNDALGRATVPAFEWANGHRDVPRPPALTRAQITRNYLDRKAALA